MRDVDPEILDTLRSVARDELGLDRPVEPDAELARDLELDSMTAIALVVAIEDRFRICLPDDELAAIRRVDELVALVARRLAC